MQKQEVDIKFWLIISGEKKNNKRHTYSQKMEVSRVTKSRRTSWAGHATCMNRLEMHTVFWLENLKGRDHSQDQGKDGKITLE
jgi:hypothetical protein